LHGPDVGVGVTGRGVIEIVGVGQGRLVGVAVAVFVAVALVVVAEAVAEALGCGDAFGLETQPATAIARTRTVIATIGKTCFIYHRTFGPLLITLSFCGQHKSHNRELGSYEASSDSSTTHGD
jgi:hypothetical protein